MTYFLLVVALFPYVVLLVAHLWSLRLRPSKLTTLGVLVGWHRWLARWHEAAAEALNRGALEYRVARKAALECADEVPACDAFLHV